MNDSDPQHTDSRSELGPGGTLMRSELGAAGPAGAEADAARRGERAPGLRGSWGGSRLCEMRETPTPVGGKDRPPLPGAPWAGARSQEVAATPAAQRAPTFARDCPITV